MQAARLSASDVVQLAFDARSAGELRQELVRRLAASVGADIGTMGSPELGATSQDAVGVDAAMLERARTPFWLSGPSASQFAPFFRALKRRRVLADTSFWSPAEKVRLPIYELCRSAGIEYFLVSLVSKAWPPVFFSLARGRGAAFDQDTEAYLASLVPALTLVNAAHPVAPPSGDQELSFPAWLTERQREICLYVAHGYTNEEIARACGISPFTARNHLVRLFRDFHVGTRTELASALLRSASQAAPRPESPWRGFW